MIHLNNKQIFFLLIPLVITFIVYNFDMEIVKNVKYFFPKYQEYNNPVLDKKADIYLKIDKNKLSYKNIEEKLKTRPKYTKWISDNILYNSLSVKTTKKSYKKNTKLHLQAVFYDRQIAIINDKPYKINSKVYNGKLIKIEKTKVLIKYKRETKWLKLF